MKGARGAAESRTFKRTHQVESPLQGKNQQSEEISKVFSAALIIIAYPRSQKHLPTHPSDPPRDMESARNTSHKPEQAQQAANLSINRQEECGRVLDRGRPLRPLHEHRASFEECLPHLNTRLKVCASFKVKFRDSEVSGVF